MDENVNSAEKESVLFEQAVREHLLQYWSYNHPPYKVRGESLEFDDQQIRNNLGHSLNSFGESYDDVVESGAVDWAMEGYKKFYRSNKCSNFTAGLKELVRILDLKEEFRCRKKASNPFRNNVDKIEYSTISNLKGDASLGKRIEFTDMVTALKSAFESGALAVVALDKDDNVLIGSKNNFEATVFVKKTFLIGDAVYHLQSESADFKESAAFSLLAMMVTHGHYLNEKEKFDHFGE